MPNELDRYNHLRYNNRASEKDDFIDFLYENTDSSAPEIDVDASWNSFSQKLTSEKKSSKNWLRIAASIVLLLSAAFYVWNVSTSVETIDVYAEQQKMNVTFPDGSFGAVNTNSSLSFNEKFGDQRLVTLEGEAYFDVKKSQKPFIIDVGGVDVKVLGTAFNLIASDETVELFVERGLVAFEKNGVQTKVAAGLKAVFNKLDNSVTIDENPSPNIMSWRNGIFEFNDTPLEAAIEDLEAYYNVSFKLQNKQLGTCRITASFDQNSLDEVIEVIESILDVRMEQRDDTVKISGQGC